VDDDLRLLIAHHEDLHVPSLGNLVGEQWRAEPDTLGARHAYRRNATILAWAESALRSRSGPRQMLDVGCAYGNHIFMTNARLGHDPSIAYTGIELAPQRVAYANAFAATIPGNENCTFLPADIEEELPFPDGTFDVVNVADVIEHLPDPEGLLRELGRVARPGGTIVVATPQRETLFKSVAKRVNRVTGGRLYEGYYEGKDAEVDDHGHAVMEVDAGHDHISEMNLDELLDAGRRAGLSVGDVELMNIMSGSSWFDRHPVILSNVLLLEAAQRRLRIRSWSHAMIVRFTA